MQLCKLSSTNYKKDPREKKNIKPVISKILLYFLLTQILYFIYFKQHIMKGVSRQRRIYIYNYYLY